MAKLTQDRFFFFLVKRLFSEGTMNHKKEASEQTVDDDVSSPGHLFPSRCYSGARGTVGEGGRRCQAHDPQGKGEQRVFGRARVPLF